MGSKRSETMRKIDGEEEVIRQEKEKKKKGGEGGTGEKRGRKTRKEGEKK